MSGWDRLWSGCSRTMFVTMVIVLQLLISSSPTFAQKKRKPISTALNAKWGQTPFVLEAAEYLNTENPDYFWTFVTDISNIDTWHSMSARDQYDTCIKLAAKSLSPSQIQLLQFSLSLKTESPMIEMFSHLASDRGVPDLGCKVVYETDGKLSCHLPLPVKTDQTLELYDIDHVYPRESEGYPDVIVYGEIGTPEFAAAHKKMLSIKGRYILRHFLSSRSQDDKVRLSGYGVELQIKSTEYKAQDDTKLKSGDDGDDSGEEGDEEVEGFLFNTLRGLHPDKTEKLTEMKQHLLDMNNDMAPMKVWQLQDLSMQAAQRIMTAPEPERLKTLVDLATNFPTHARSLTRTSVTKELKKEVKKNSDIFLSTLNIQPTDAALFINGQYFDMDYSDMFTILDTLRSEERVLGGLGSLGLTSKQIQYLMNLNLVNKQQTQYGVDIRDSAIHWVNDIEKGKLYKGWPDSVQELLRPTFPGMLRSIKKNFFNVVIMCDPAAASTKPLLKLLESFYVHRAPVRIGLLFSVSTDEEKTGENDAGIALANAYNYISTNKDAYDGLAFITDVYSKSEDDSEDVDVKDVRETFMDTYGADVKMIDVFGEDSEYDVGRTLSAEFISRSGLGELPQVLMNGVPMEQKYLTGEDFEEQLLTSLMKETQALQRSVYKNELSDSMDTVDFLMKRENIMPRLNQRVLSTSSNPVISLLGEQSDKVDSASFADLDKKSQTATLTKKMNYLVGKESSKMSKLRMVTAWVVADLETDLGRDMALSAISHVKTTNQMRVGIISNSESAPGLISKIVVAALEHLDSAGATAVLSKVLKKDTAKKLVSGKKKLSGFDIPGVEMSDFIKNVDAVDEDIFKVHSIFAENVLRFNPGQRGLVVNGKVIGPLLEDEEFTADDFELLEKLTMSQYGEKLVQAFYNHLDVQHPEVSDQAMIVSGLLSTRPAGKTRNEISFRSDQHSVITLEPGQADQPAFDIVAVVDPVSRGAQKIAPLLTVLESVVNAKIRIFLNCIDKHSEMPNKSYFRQVLEPRLMFKEDGSLSEGPRAVFQNMPETPILTMAMHVPDNWLVEPVRSVYDLDNIKLENIDGAVTSVWELNSLLLEGHCFESGTGNPPRGLQLTLGTKNHPGFTDTIVMANLGYLQLKAAPGAWYLNLREGRSADIYDIVSQENTDSKTGDKDVTVLMNSFQSRIIKLKVSKKADKRNEELLPQDSSDGDSGGWFSSITNKLSSGSGDDAEEDQGLNIFCVATGHLYERLLKIMMLSVLKTTKTPVKFWILKNFLSPSLKDFIPEYAKRYGFEYEYVQYKWPRWLNQQTNKQRIIWGYKILFLDVLFPLNLKKVIFVDTDQIIRTDLLELRELDLGGAPYGYTPFCDSNEDMEGFRFWKQGYWRNHLAGRKYHISALYVIDLVKFRQIAAGDRLRGQYQALSQDPNSLANLDQDLPNNMIHQVPIKSLPQEWLWCETWCSKEGLATAKSIDLCNNPLTKEPKLSAARRIVSEWTDYDEEMHRLGEQIAKDRAATNTSVDDNTDDDINDDTDNKKDEL